LSCTNSKQVGSKNQWFPELYGGDALMLCVNADRTTIDRKRSLQSIYFVPDSYVVRSPLAQRRDLLAVFMGAVLDRTNAWWYLRRYLLDGMRQCSDCVGVELQQHMPPDKRTQKRWDETLRRARFHIIPPGDSLERGARDQSLAAGVVPVIFDFMSGARQSNPMSPPLLWSSFSVNFTLTREEWPGKANFWPRLEALLRELVVSKKADRLLANAVAVQARLSWTEEGVFRTVIDMLDRRRGLLA